MDLIEKKASYIIAIINEFALAHTLNSQQAYRYLFLYKGLELVDKYYDIEHTLSFELQTIAEEMEEP